MGTRLTVDQLEKMKTHELADLLGSIVLLLKRMPDVEWKQFVQHEPGTVYLEQPAARQTALSESSFTFEELNKKTVDQLKMLAKELNVLFSSSIKKAKLIEKILAKSTDGRSEQWAIQNM